MAPKKEKKEEIPEKFSFDSFFAQLNKQMGAGTVFLLGNGPSLRVDAIPTQSLGVNKALGIGGLPRGRVVEIYGNEGCGKTSLCLGLIAEAQKIAKTIGSGRKCAYVDPECGLVVETAELVGVDINDLVYSQPSCGEEALDLVEAMIRSNMFDVVVLDSVSALVPKKELEGNMEDISIGLQARLMSKALRKLTALVAKTKTTLIFINQIREKIGVMYGPSTTTSGGVSLKFYSSVRIEMRRGEGVKLNKEQIGHNLNVKIIKNRCAPPHKKATYAVIYDQGIDLAQELCDHGVEEGILSKGGAWYTLLDENGKPVMIDKKTAMKWNGIDALRQAMNNDPALKEMLAKRFNNKIQERMKDIPVVDEDETQEYTQDDAVDYDEVELKAPEESEQNIEQDNQDQQENINSNIDSNIDSIEDDEEMGF